MNKLLLSIVFSLTLSCMSFAQGGAKFSSGVSLIKQDFLPTDHSFTGWNIRLSARLGSGVWFFSPELNYENYNVIPTDVRNPWANNVRIHTLKMPMGIGWKFKTTPFQKVFIKGGIVGSYVMIIDENDSIDFNNIADLYAGYYGTIGYDFHWFTIDYRYEKSIMDNYSKIENSKFLFHSINMGINF